jgi:hypothetical protein
MFHKSLLVDLLRKHWRGLQSLLLCPLKSFSRGMCCFMTFALIVGCAHGEVWNVINFLWEGEVT